MNSRKRSRREVISTRDVLFDENFIYDDIIPQFEIDNASILEKYVVEPRDGLLDKEINETIDEGAVADEGAVENVDREMKDVAGENAEIKKISRFSTRHDFPDFSTFSPEDAVQLTKALLIKLDIAPLNPELCYECELQNSTQINEAFQQKIISPIHGVLTAFAADRLFKRLYISELPPAPTRIKELDQHFMKDEFLKAIERTLFKKCIQSMLRDIKS